MVSLPGYPLKGRPEKDYAAATEMLDDLKRRSPRHIGVNYFRGLVAFENEDLDAAVSALREVQARSPNHEPTLLLLGATHVGT